MSLAVNKIAEDKSFVLWNESTHPLVRRKWRQKPKSKYKCTDLYVLLVFRYHQIAISLCDDSVAIYLFTFCLRIFHSMLTHRKARIKYTIPPNNRNTTATATTTKKRILLKLMLKLNLSHFNVYHMLCINFTI